MHDSHGLIYCITSLQPGNVLLTDNNEAVLMDFGSVAEGRVTIANRQQALAVQENADILCTPQYQSWIIVVVVVVVCWSLSSFRVCFILYSISYIIFVEFFLFCFSFSFLFFDVAVYISSTRTVQHPF